MAFLLFSRRIVVIIQEVIRTENYVDGADLDGLARHHHANEHCVDTNRLFAAESCDQRNTANARTTFFW